MRALTTLVALLALAWAAPVTAQTAQAAQADAPVEPGAEDSDDVGAATSHPEPDAGSTGDGASAEAESEAWSDWGFGAGLNLAMHESSAGVLRPMAGGSLSLSRALTPSLGVRGSLTILGARPGVDGTWTVELHNHLGAQLVVAAAVHERATLFFGVGPGLRLATHAHRSPSNTVWAVVAAPTVSLSAGADATLPGFGLRFSVDAWLHPDFVEVGGGLQALVPFS